MKATELLYYSVHPHQLRAMIQWKLWHTPLNERDPSKETPELRRCFDFLNLTSRSFSAVIQELCPELMVSISLFYLVLRALDTIEDDMTIPLARKEPLLRGFDEVLSQQGWHFSENGPDEKDRQLCVEFYVVISEFAKIPPEHQVIIKDIAKKMGNGMADYVINAEHNEKGVDSIQDYDLYCHYVAGLVGHGLTRFFCVSQKANPALLDRLELSNSMGLFLQKTNIIRDYREDLEDGRRFWPREIWIKHTERYEDLPKPGYEEAALNCISEMCLDALRHANDCLFYLAGLKEQSVFNFAAIPQVMAVATLALVFRNKNVYQRNVKIPKGEACELMTEVGNLRSVCNVFRKYLNVIRSKNTPKDPNFLKISAACGKVDQFIETLFPREGPKAAQQKEEAALVAANGQTPEQQKEARKEMMYLMAAVFGTLFVISALMMGTAYLLGARFDIAMDEIKKGNIIPPKQGSLGAPSAPPAPPVHGEL